MQGSRNGRPISLTVSYWCEQKAQPSHLEGNHVESQSGKNRIDSLCRGFEIFLCAVLSVHSVHQNYATPWIIAKQPTTPRNVLFKHCTTVAGSFSILTFRLGWVEWEFYLTGRSTTYVELMFHLL